MAILTKMILSLLLGAVIGLERESYEAHIDKTERSGIGSLGVRSFALITLLGAVAGFMYPDYLILSTVISIVFMILLVVYYILGSIFTKDNGLTTELAIIFAYLIGLFIALEIFPLQITIALTVILILILSIKEKIKIIIAGIKQTELRAFISYAIIALVILPFLPDVSYKLADFPALVSIIKAYGINLSKIANLEIINPFGLWRVVALITGIDIIGYLLEKTIGQKKGWLLTSFAGGFISSTSTTQSLAQKSKKGGDINQLTSAAIVANFASFIQLFLLIATINSLFLTKVTLYLFSLVISSLLLGIYFMNREKKSGDNLTETKEEMNKIEIFSLKPALQFAGLYLLIKLFAGLSLVFFGNSGFFITVVFASFIGLDAIMINVAQLAGQTLSYSTAIIALIIANTTNLTVKSFYVYLQADRRMFFRFASSMALIITAGLLSALFIL